MRILPDRESFCCSFNIKTQFHVQSISTKIFFSFNLIFKEEEEVPVTSLHYYDNKLAVDHLMSKPHGLFYLIDEATRGRQSQDFITGKNSTHFT